MTELIDSIVTPGGDAAVRLRDLDDAGFCDRYGCDRFTATVLTNRFRYIAQHMANEVRTHAFSPVIRDGSDLCAMVSGPAQLEYPMVAVSETMPLFYGSIPNAVRIVIEEYGPEDLEPGDVIIVNDYYRVGTHLNDACLIRPIFLDDEIVGAITMRAHFLDMGGIVMGGFEATKRNTWEDGLRIPPTLLHHRGKPVKSTLKLLFDNTRLGFLCIPDLITEVRALEVGERLLTESINRYGLEAYTGAVRYACDSSAEAMAEALRSIPDGVYEGEDFLDGDGFPDAPELAVRVRITKVGDRAEVDLRGTSPTSRGAVNGAWPDINTALVYAFKSVLDPNTPVTSGTLRNIDSVVGPDVLCNVSPPTPCQLYFLVVFTMVHAVHQALNPVLGERAGAAGYVTGTPSAFEIGPDGVERTLYGAGGPMVIGAWGANRHGDADSSQQSPLGNIIDGGVEIFERNSQALWASSDYVPDSGGAGTFRGGAAILYDILWTAPADHRMQLLFHSRRPPAGGGVNGGKAGPTTTAWLFDGDLTDGGTKLPELPTSTRGDFYRDATPYGGVIDPETGEADPEGRHIVLTERMPRSKGAVARVMNAAGGGWGDPWERDPALVCRDVRDEYVTFEGAARDYGVVVLGDLQQPEQIHVDEGATRELRARQRS